MKRLPLLMLLVCSTAVAKSKIETYPQDWPKLTGMSASCEEIQGTYSDPNTFRWDKIDKKKNTKYGAVRVAAWSVFKINGDIAKPSDKTITSRLFTITIDENQVLRVDYALENQIVSSKIFTKESYICDDNGLTLTTLDRTGDVMDKLPNWGNVKTIATLYKKNNALYIKYQWKNKALILYVIPTFSKAVRWFRFLEKID